MTTTALRIRPATLDDRDAASQLLAASYAVLRDAPGYAPGLMARALPAMSVAQTSLLACGTWYLAELEGALVGCGGWTAERPGTREVEAGLAHLRHFGTHPDYLGRGVARALVERCFADALRQGRTRWECWSTLLAEPFYARMGFVATERREVSMGPELELPCVIMHRGEAGLG